MPILARPTLKRYYENGKGLGNQAWVALLDSFLALQDTTAQELLSNLIINQVIVTGAVSAGEAQVRELLEASAAHFTGIISHGSGATSGEFVTVQEATVAATATTQIALLPNSANIVGLGVKVLRQSSGAGGGTEIRFGNGAAIDYFGTITVSGNGVFKPTAVCAVRLQGTSGAVFAAGITATANAAFVPYVQYYQTASAPQSNVISEITAFTSAIGNMITGGGLAAAFDGNTSQGQTSGARAVSTVRGFVGQAWNTPRKIARAIIYDANNDGLSTGGLQVILRIRGNNTNDINTAAVLASVNTTYVIPTTAYSLNEADIDFTNAYSYHWVELSATPTSTLVVAEIRLWEIT